MGQVRKCSICHLCKYEANCCFVIPILHFAGTSVCLCLGLCYRQDWAGGKTVFPHMLACFSRQLHALIRLRADTNAVFFLSSRYKIRNNCNLLNMQY